MKKSQCNYGRSRNLEFTIGLARPNLIVKLTAQLESCYVTSLVTRTNHNTVRTIDIYVQSYRDGLSCRTDFHTTPASTLPLPPTAAQLAAVTDANLFRAITLNPIHVFSGRLADKPTHNYSLRSRAYNFALPKKVEKNCIHPLQQKVKHHFQFQIPYVR